MLKCLLQIFLSSHLLLTSLLEDVYAATVLPGRNEVLCTLLTVWDLIRSLNQYIYFCNKNT